MSSLARIRKLWVELDNPDVRTDGIIGEGEVGQVYAVRGQEAVLKVSKHRWADLGREGRTLMDLTPVSGVPNLIRNFIHESFTIALMIERVRGKDLDEVLMNCEDEQVLVVLMNLRALINRWHGQGMKLPEDWVKPGNVLVTDNMQPHTVDVGMARPGGRMDFGMDNRIFRSAANNVLLRRQRKKTIGLRARRDVEGFIYEDSVRHPGEA